MNILYYALPLFLNEGESFRYSISHLTALMSYSKDIDIFPKIIKEKILPPNKVNNSIPPIESLDFSLSNLSPINDFIKKNNIDIYHCFHNGFSLSNNFLAPRISTIYTTLPLTPSKSLDPSYDKLYLDRIINTFNLSNSIIVPYTFMKNDLCNFFGESGENIYVIPPFMNSDLIGNSKPLSLSYVNSKFNIQKNYYIYIGEINPRNNLLDTIRLFKYYSSNSDVKLVLSLRFLPKNKKLYLDLVSFIDRIGLSSKIVFINNLCHDDFTNLINGALCFINLNPFNELNVTSLYALFFNTKILTYQSNNNLEFLENFPIYISDYMGGYNIDLSVIDINEPYMDIDELIYIADKFSRDSVLNELLDVYNTTIKERSL